MKKALDFLLSFLKQYIICAIVLAILEFESGVVYILKESLFIAVVFSLLDLITWLIKQHKAKRAKSFDNQQSQSTEL